jgi:hypothetical protein
MNARLLLPLALAVACRGDQGLIAVAESGASSTEPPAFAPSAPAVTPCDPKVTWCPGEDIPGWPSAVPDLSAIEGKPIVEFDLPNREVEVRFGAITDAENPQDWGVSEPNLFLMLFGDCDDWDCTYASEAEEPRWIVNLAAGTEGEPSPLGLGWYGDRPCHGEATGPYVNTFLVPAEDFNNPPSSGCYNDGNQWTLAPSMAFLSEVRPDRIRGLVYFDLTGDLPTWYHDPAVYLMNFEVLFPLHGGIQGTWKHIGPEEVEHVHYKYYGPTYDEAWPWSSITDDGIRERVYDLYFPYLGSD